MPSKSRTKPKTLEQLYYDEIRDVYDAEHRILKALPKLVKAASSEELRDAFQQHFDKTQEHVERLEQVFESMDKTATAKKCDGMRGILEEGAEILELQEGPAKDAGLIAGAQRVEHYEISAYGTLRTWADQLGRDGDSDLLQQTLDEEKEADDLLTEIAQRINEAAEEGGSEETRTSSEEDEGTEGEQATEETAQAR